MGLQIFCFSPLRDLSSFTEKEKNNMWKKEARTIILLRSSKSSDALTPTRVISTCCEKEDSSQIRRMSPKPDPIDPIIFLLVRSERVTSTLGDGLRPKDYSRSFVSFCFLRGIERSKNSFLRVVDCGGIDGAVELVIETDKYNVPWSYRKENRLRWQHAVPPLFDGPAQLDQATANV